MKGWLYVILLLFLGTNFIAHPVIWKGGTAIMHSQNNDIAHTAVFYSKSSRWAYGYHEANFINLDKKQFLQVNFLAKRWNGLQSQGNIYMGSALGQSTNDDHLEYYASLQADWENRRYFSYIKSAYYSGKNAQFELSARLGVAPYEAQFNRLHLWFMIEGILQRGDLLEQESLMPLVRVFKGQYLLEYGSNFKNRQFIAFMYHF